VSYTAPEFLDGTAYGATTWQALADEVEALSVGKTGLIDSSVQTADITASSSTKVFHSSAMVTADLTIGYTYRGIYTGALRGNTSMNYANVYLFYEAGSTVTASGTQLTGAKKVLHSAYSANGLRDITVTGVFVAPSTEEYTVGVCIALGGGGGTVTLDQANGNEALITLECVKTT
jgi:hypothetical protein